MRLAHSSALGVILLGLGLTFAAGCGVDHEIRRSEGDAPAAEAQALGLETTRLAAPEVTTSFGKVRGKPVTQGVAYLGIPYAAAPIGPLRWKDPVDPTPWAGVRDAFTLPAFCPQPELVKVSEVDPPAATVSEDCLYLNVWTPAAAKPKLPVMVWIHGGGLTQGGTAGEPTVTMPVDPKNPNGPAKVWDRFYDGEALANKAGVVLVSFNYRLGVLGNFPHPLAERANGASTANLNAQDMLKALRWVQKNVAQFGGDPANVTLFGESAGAISTCSMIASPAAKGLFHKAIMQSGPCGSVALGDVAVQTQKWAESLPSRCTTLECLQKVPYEELMKRQFVSLPAPSSLKTKTFVFQGGFYVDGRILSEPIDVTFAAGRQNKVPVLLGHNLQEFPTLALSPAQQKMTDADYLAALVQDFGAAGGKKLYDAFPPKKYAGKTLPGYTPASYATADVINATMVAAPVRKVARLLSRSQPTYRYVASIAYQQGIQNLLCRILPVCGSHDVLLGTFHGMELPLTMQHIDEFYRDVVSTRSPFKVSPSLSEQAAQLNFLAAYAAFAHFGVAAAWTPYQEKADVTNDVNAWVKPVAGFQKTAGEVFDSVYPSLGVGF